MGDYTQKFYSEKDIIKAAKEFFKKHFDDNWILTDKEHNQLLPK